jgi:hypothetical protein
VALGLNGVYGGPALLGARGKLGVSIPSSNFRRLAFPLAVISRLRQSQACEYPANEDDEVSLGGCTSCGASKLKELPQLIVSLFLR